ncbi:MAG: hypothetical protein CL678_04535 [Bdellovibrionaceae bacterium]|nr:hypothetical protein [Pseudobdellovibrionaceae bacterium]|tara:strand:- start:2035 stop:2661 length:627 start_codon:yes stop_codon:yes gene_type:complete
MWEGHTLWIRQQKEWIEIAVDWEMANQYQVLDSEKLPLGWVIEERKGWKAFFVRGFLRSRRPFSVHVMNMKKEVQLFMKRPFFFLFSRMEVKGAQGEIIGFIQQRFGILYKKYDLLDNQGFVFSRIQSPLWRLWTFPIRGIHGEEIGGIHKRWGGILREVFSDADTYQVHYANYPWTENQKKIAFAAAVSIDFDYFENNQGRRGGIFR